MAASGPTALPSVTIFSGGRTGVRPVYEDVMSASSNQLRKTNAMHQHISAALEALQSACQGVRLYGPVHPFVDESVGRAQASFKVVVNDASPLLVGVSNHGFLVRDQPMPTSSAIDTLAMCLHAKNVAMMEIHSVSSDALQTLVMHLTGSDASEQWLDRANQDLRSSIVLHGLRADGLRFTATCAAKTGHNGGADDSFWSALMGNLLNPAAVEKTPGDLAAQLNARQRLGPEELTQLRSRIAEALPEDAPTEEGEGPYDHVSSSVHERLRSFAGALTPRLRQSLLSLDPNDDPAHIESFVATANVFPVEDVVSALEKANDGLANPAHEVVQMFRKLQQVLSDRALQRGLGERLSAAVEGLANLESAADDVEAWQTADDIGESVAELFTTRTEADYSPDDYRAHIDDLVDAAPIAEPRVVKFQGVTQQSLALHATEIAAHVVVADPPSASKPGGYRCVAREIQTLVAADRLDLLDGVLQVVRKLKPTDVSDETFSAASEVIRASRDAGFLSGLLQQPDFSKASHSVLSGLFRSAGSAGLVFLLGYSRNEEPAWVAVTIDEIIHDLSDDELAAVVHRLNGDDHQKIMRLLSQIEPVRRSSIALQAIQSPEDVGSSSSIELLRDSVNWTADVVAEMLSSPRPELQLLAFDQIEQHPALDADGSRLAGYAAGRSMQTPPPVKHVERAVWMLVSLPNGCARLAATLDALRTREITTSPFAGRQLADVMQKYADDREVAAALRRWKRSPRNALGAITRRLNREDRNAA